jgi:hypothetical protein
MKKIGKRTDTNDDLAEDKNYFLIWLAGITFLLVSYIMTFFVEYNTLIYIKVHLVLFLVSLIFSTFILSVTRYKIIYKTIIEGRFSFKKIGYWGDMLMLISSLFSVCMIIFVVDFHSLPGYRVGFAIFIIIIKVIYELRLM